MAETASNIDELKVHLDTLFNFASQVSYTQNHLLPVIQAGKSLIGIKPEYAPKNLLKWLEEYVKEFSLIKSETFGGKELENPEVIDISKLEELPEILSLISGKNSFIVFPPGSSIRLTR